MGCCQSTFDREGKSRNDQIDDQIRRDKVNLKNEIKMLLLGKWTGVLSFFFFGQISSLNSTLLCRLGAGESGKSTILKQMKLIHDGGYSEDEREAFREIIYSNTVQSMRVILEAMETLSVPLREQHNRHHAEIIMEQPSQIEKEFLAPEITDAIRSLWNDSNLLSVFERSREYQLNDSAK